jgi:hypothetical protein
METRVRGLLLRKLCEVDCVGTTTFSKENRDEEPLKLGTRVDRTYVC